MKKHEIFSKLRTNWTYEFFLELISSYEKNATSPKNYEAEINKKRISNNFAETWGFEKFDSKYDAIESEGDTKKRDVIEKILKNEIPTIKPETNLHKIIWYRIWFYLVLRGELSKDYFVENYTAWRKSKGLRYFEVLSFYKNRTASQNATPIDVFLLGGIPSKEILKSKIELIAPLISHPYKAKTKKDTSKVIGKKNLEEIKLAIDKAIVSGKIAGLRKATGKEIRHKYSGNKNELYEKMVKSFRLKIKESIFNRGISEFVETKAK